MQHSLRPFSAAAEVPAADVLSGSAEWTPMDPAEMRWVQAGCPSPEFSCAPAPLTAEILIRLGVGIEVMALAAKMLQIGSPLAWSCYAVLGLGFFLRGALPVQVVGAPAPIRS